MTNLGSTTTRFALDRPRFVVRAVALITIVLALGAVLPSLFPGALGPLPQARIDTDPENMLPSDDPVRVFHNARKATFGLNDAVVLGVVNEAHADGVFNPATLAKVHAITAYAQELEGVIAADVMAPSTLDSISNAGPGTVSFDWLMPTPPETREQSLAVRDRALRIPFLKDTLVSADGKAIVVYIPIADKDVAHEVAESLRGRLDELGAGDDQFHIAGLPVAEDTFGIEMFVQMAISAPMAMVVIFVLMWVYFRRLSIIVAPMLVAMAAALSTMALLVITGNTVHIMSSMIPIFIMPIAVLDAVHIISDFFDTYPKTRDRRKTLETVMRHLSAPMLFTSLTTAVGFASLALTPIPPVQVFGIFVAFGVLAAWFLTIIFVPAFVMLLSEKRLANFGRVTSDDKPASGLLGRLGRMRPVHAKLVAIASTALLAVAAYGITQISVNDNPTKWFEDDHEIRIADRVLNRHFGGTYDAYLSLAYERPRYDPSALGQELRDRLTKESDAVRSVFAQVASAMRASEAQDPFELLEQLDSLARAKRMSESTPESRVAWSLVGLLLEEQFERVEEIEDGEASGPGGRDGANDALAAAAEQRSGEIFALLGDVAAAVTRVAEKKPATEAAFLGLLRKQGNDRDDLAFVLGPFVDRALQTHEVFKRPKVLAYVEQLQQALQGNPAVGKSNSLADIVKVVHRDLVSGDEKDYHLPTTSDGVGQILTQYQSSHRKDDLWHFVTKDYQDAVVWFQLKSGDNREMESVVASLEEFVAQNPPPVAMTTPRWFGLTYINVVWQQKMVTGMVGALLGSFVVVLLMMTVLFRSVLWGVLSMIPLTLTVSLIYGVLGIVGKDYDMPVAVLSSLSLGLAIDYAIHFLARARELRGQHETWAETLVAVFGSPARAIARNVIVVGVGFLPLLLAPLVPYQTVGILIASILLAAGAATLVILPALLTLLQSRAFAKTSPSGSAHS